MELAELMPQSRQLGDSIWVVKVFPRNAWRVE